MTSTRWTTIAGFAEHLQVSAATVRRRIADGMPVIRDGGIVRIPIAEAEDWLRGKPKGPAPAPLPVVVCEVLQ